MRRIAKGVGIGFGIAVVAAVVSVLALAGFAQSRWGCELIRGAAMAAANRVIAGRVRIGSLSLSLRHIVVDELVLEDPAGGVVARVPRVALTVALRPLLHRELLLRRVDVSSPAMRLVLQAGSSNLARALARRRAPHRLQLAITVRALAARGGQVLVERDGDALALVRGVTIDGNARAKLAARSFAAALTVHGWSARAPSGGVVLAIRGSGVRGIQAGRVAVRIGAGVDATARVLGRDRYVVRLSRVAITPELGRLLTSKWPLAATVELGGVVTLDGPRLDADVKARAAGAQLHVAGAVNRRRRTTAGLTLAAAHLDPARLLGRGPAGDVTVAVDIARGSLAPSAIAGSATIDARLARTRPGAARGHAAVRVRRGEVHASAQLRSGASVRLALAARLHASATRPREVDVAIRDAALAYGPRGRIVRQWRQRGHAELDLGHGHVRVDGLALASSGQRVVLDGAFDGGRVRATAALDGFRLQSLRPFVARLPPLDAAVDGTLAFERTRAGHLIASARLSSRIGRDQVAARVHLRRRRELLLASARVATVGDGSLSAKAALSLRQRRLRGTIRLVDFDTTWLAAALPEVDRVQGIVDGTVELGGTLGRPAFVGSLAWRNGAVIARSHGARNREKPRAATGRARRPSRNSAAR